MQKQSPHLNNADLEWQDSGAPFSSQFQDIYFSRQGGLGETEHVFIAANHLRERWSEWENRLATQHDGMQSHFTIAELGFGTGLNFLCCCRAWQTLAPKHLRLHYIACEKYPLQHAALARALSQWTELEHWSVQLLAQYPDHSPGYHRLIFHNDADCADVTLDLHFGDALQSLAALAAPQEGVVDAWFLDGFAPRTNPDLWNAELFSQLNVLSRSGATLSTYSVAGVVVKALKETGFATEKTAGFGKKRHMLQGRFLHRIARETNSLPRLGSWLQVHWPERPPAHVIVIGAGMAGCSTAWSLARRGWRVTVLESSDDIAQGASGNRQAVLQCRLNNAVNAAWQFNLQAFLHAARHFAWMQEIDPAISWDACGVLNLDTAFQSRRENCPDVRLDLYSPSVVRRFSQAEASALAGIDLDGGGNFIPLGGWLNPAAMCRAWLRHPLISTCLGAQAEQLIRRDGQWVVLGPDGKLLSSSTVVVMANSSAATRLAQTADYVMTPLRGQVSYVQESAESAGLRTVVCGRSYITPPHSGAHSTGASYSKNVSDLTLSAKDDADNIAGIAAHLPQGVLLNAALTGGRVSVRAATGDRMPMVGPVADIAALQSLYRSLPQRERKSPTVAMPCHEGLYLNVGHGSHGLSNTPLAAEYLASLLSGEALPLQREMIECLHPARFVLRILRREPAPN
jgi:tRNA 5-methylaminomethyl-2-thiouridine biosynthesis bifunctional protein